MNREQIVEPVTLGGERVLNLPIEAPEYLVRAVYTVNLSGSELTLILPNGLRAILSPGTDLKSLAKLVKSEAFQDAIESMKTPAET